MTNLISAFLLPPLNLLLLGTAGLLLWHRRPALARGLVATSLALLWLLCTPFVSMSLLRLLEGAPVALDPKAQLADAIVVLGGGTLNAPEYGAETVGSATLVRLRYAARLLQETKRPVLVSGGRPQGNALSEAQQMKAALEEEFHVPVMWTEEESNNTYESARFSHRMLAPHGVRRIYLVTHAWHMPRAARAFQAAGFEVIPAPTAYSTVRRTGVLDFLPNAGALQDSQHFAHEVIGLLWYRVKTTWFSA